MPALSLPLVLHHPNSLNRRISQGDDKRVIVAYVGGFRGDLAEIDSIDPHKLSHINYAFVDVQGNRAFLSNEKTDTVNFRLLKRPEKSK